MGEESREGERRRERDGRWRERRRRRRSRRRRRVNDGIIHKVTITSSSSSDDQSFAKGIKDGVLRQYKLFCTASSEHKFPES
jgi:hypothetical protein